MVKRNPNFTELSNRYLFPEIQARKSLFLQKNPDAKIISLGIGDTTEPIPHSIAQGLIKKAEALATRDGYSGYSPEQGIEKLRCDIAAQYYKSKVCPDEIFISDGTKCDIGRLQQLFGSDITIAVQDPSYPVYVDGSIIEGVKNIVYMACTSDNSFFPNLLLLPPVDLIYFCSPNNPTGAVATREQLAELVRFAKKNQAIIIFDAAYSWYIQDPSLPKSIYEIPGADEVAIELGSFSKLAGFTGVRLGWAVIPSSLKFEDGTPVSKDWQRLTSTIFNAASNIAQYGGMAALSPDGLQDISKLIAFYLANASLIREVLMNKGLEVYGGENAPYLWVKFPGKNSWEVFAEILERVQILTTPGVGFGRSGEGFIRFTAFSQRENLLEGISRLKNLQV